jgi:hypothetical protein
MLEIFSLQTLVTQKELLSHSANSNLIHKSFFLFVLIFNFSSPPEGLDTNYDYVLWEGEAGRICNRWTEAQQCCDARQPLCN